MFIERGEERAQESDLVQPDQLLIATSRTLSQPQERSQAPFPDFETPFIGWSTDDLRTEFRMLFIDSKERKRPFTSRTFIVLDERSIEDETCMIVSDSIEKCDARADLFIPLEILAAPEGGSHELNEGAKEKDYLDPVAGKPFFYHRDQVDKESEEHYRSYGLKYNGPSPRKRQEEREM